MNIVSWEYIVKTKKENIDIINKITEAYEGLAIIRTLNANEGMIKILSLSCNLIYVDRMIDKLKRYGIELEILDKREWLGIL